MFNFFGMKIFPQSHFENLNTQKVHLLEGGNDITRYLMSNESSTASKIWVLRFKQKFACKQLKLAT